MFKTVSCAWSLFATSDFGGVGTVDPSGVVPESAYVFGSELGRFSDRAVTDFSLVPPDPKVFERMGSIDMVIEGPQCPPTPGPWLRKPRIDSLLAKQVLNSRRTKIGSGHFHDVFELVERDLKKAPEVLDRFGDVLKKKGGVVLKVFNDRYSKESVRAQECRMKEGVREYLALKALGIPVPIVFNIESMVKDRVIVQQKVDMSLADWVKSHPEKSLREYGLEFFDLLLNASRAEGLFVVGDFLAQNFGVIDGDVVYIDLNEDESVAVSFSFGDSVYWDGVSTRSLYRDVENYVLIFRNKLRKGGWRFTAEDRRSVMAKVYEGLSEWLEELVAGGRITEQDGDYIFVSDLIKRGIELDLTIERSRADFSSRREEVNPLKRSSATPISSIDPRNSGRRKRVMVSSTRSRKGVWRKEEMGSSVIK